MSIDDYIQIHNIVKLTIVRARSNKQTNTHIHTPLKKKTNIDCLVSLHIRATVTKYSKVTHPRNNSWFSVF